MQPRITQVPPTRYSSATNTRAPYCAAIRAARTPPEPAPMTRRSTSCSAICRAPAARQHRRSAARCGAGNDDRAPRGSSRQRLDFMPSLFHFGAHPVDYLLRQSVRPNLRISHALIENPRLFRKQLAAEGRFVKGERVLEFLLLESGGVKLGGVVQDFRSTRRVVRAQLGGDLIEVFAQHRIGLQENALGLLDNPGDDRLVERVAAFCRDQLLGGGERARRLFRARRSDGRSEKKRERDGVNHSGRLLSKH